MLEESLDCKDDREDSTVDVQKDQWEFLQFTIDSRDDGYTWIMDGKQEETVSCEM